MSGHLLVSGESTLYIILDDGTKYLVTPAPGVSIEKIVDHIKQESELVCCMNLKACRKTIGDLAGVRYVGVEMGVGHRPQPHQSHAVFAHGTES